MGFFLLAEVLNTLVRYMQRLATAKHDLKENKIFKAALC